MSNAVVIVFHGTTTSRFDGVWTIKVMRNGMLRLNSKEQQFVFKDWDYYKLIRATGAVV